jgi:3-oxoacyl-[acyl-carrier protein] reductase
MDLGLAGAAVCVQGGSKGMGRSAAECFATDLAAMSARSQGFGLIEYTAAKAALTSITKNLSLELAPDGILANTISPGIYVSDQMVRHITTLPADAGISANDPRSVMRYISEFFGVRADLGRAGIPPDIAPVICLLASERNTYTTGANINVDGGSNFDA